MLYDRFYKHYGVIFPFYSVHDCFGTTSIDVKILKTILGSVYTELYYEDHYLFKFDECIVSNITSHYKFDPVKIIELPEGNTCESHAVNWVINNKDVKEFVAKRIDYINIYI